MYSTYLFILSIVIMLVAIVLRYLDIINGAPYMGLLIFGVALMFAGAIAKESRETFSALTYDVEQMALDLDLEPEVKVTHKQNLSDEILKESIVNLSTYKYIKYEYIPSKSSGKDVNESDYLLDKDK